MIYVITINYNNSTETIDCLNSLKAVETEFKIIVIDNKSSIEDYSFLERYIEKEEKTAFLKNDSDSFVFDDQTHLLLIREHCNLGFAGGNNHGIQIARSQVDFEGALLLNNDTLVHPHFLDEIIQFRKTCDVADLIGGRIFYEDPGDVIWYDGGLFNRHITKVSHINENKRLSQISTTSVPHETEFITGCLLFISKKCLDKTGLLDDSLFMYCEDLEYCIRAKEKGFTLYHVPTSIIWHKVSSSTGGVLSEFSAYWLIRNRFKVAHLHANYMDRILTLLFFVITRIHRFSKWFILGYTGTIKAQIRGMMDGLK